jgi:peptide/nickel transport system ATP-binding protein
MTHLISVKDLSVSFQLGKDHRVPAVRGVSFDVPANSTVALVGESGSGKSVSAMSIVRLLPENAVLAPESQVLYQGQDLLHLPVQAMRALRGKDISVVFQEPMSSLNPVFTVGEQIAEVLRIHLKMSKKQALDRTLELMTEVGIPQARSRLNAYPHELSGGQQQRVMIAMAIACEPKLLIADEPTTALDVTVQRQIMELLARLQQRQRMSVLFISHDLGLVGEISHHVVVMRAGEVREAGPVAAIFTAPQDAYTQALLACRPRLDSRPRRLAVIEDFMQQRPVITEQRVARPMGDKALIEVKGLRKEYRLKEGLFKHRVVEAVKEASFSLHKGRTLGVVGESGSGKTTVGMMLTRLTEATTGSILFEGQDLMQLNANQMRPYRSRIQIIFQNPYASLNPRFTVGQILLEPMRIHDIARNDDVRARMALSLLDKVGLSADAFGKYPHEFSGGQRQRIAISHDLAVVRYMADEILVMSEGAIVERGSAEDIYARPQHPYTQQLLGAIPRGYTQASS